MRPHVLVNVAMSADGKLSTRERRQVRISGPLDFARVDQIRAESDAVMVGIGTVIADDPSLTIKSPQLREWRKSRGLEEHPARIVVDSKARTPPGAAVLHKGEGMRIIACSHDAEPDNIRALAPYATVIRTGQGRVDLPVLLDALYQKGIEELMVEGGGTLIWALFQAGLVDELTCFVGNMIIGGRDAPTLADGEGFISEDSFIRLRLIEAEQVEEGLLLRWKVLPQVI